MGATKRQRCGTVGCKSKPTEEISFRFRGGPEVDTELACTPCADGYSRRVVLVDFTRKPLPFPTLEAAARAYGASHGVTGKAGGWLYRNGTHLCQGWRTYGFRLVEAGLIDPQDTDGRSVRRVTVGRTVHVAAERGWRYNATQYAITEKRG